MRHHKIAGLVSAVLLLSASHTAQAGSFFSFNFSFDNYGGYYTPYRYVYAPAYYHGWPHYYGYTHVYPVTYAYYPSVFYRPVYPYRYPYYAYHPHWHKFKPHYYKYGYNKPHYNHYSYRSRVVPSTHVYGYQQPQKTYYSSPKNYYKEQQYRDKHYNRYDKRRYDHYQAGQTQREADNERAARKLSDRNRALWEAQRKQNDFRNTRPGFNSVAPRQSDKQHTQVNSQQITFNTPAKGVQSRNDKRTVDRSVQERRQSQQHNNNQVRAVKNLPSGLGYQNRKLDQRAAARTQAEPKNNNAFQQAQRAVPQWHERGSSGVSRNIPHSNYRKNEGKTSSSKASAYNKSMAKARNTFRSGAGSSGFRN